LIKKYQQIDINCGFHSTSILSTKSVHVIKQQIGIGKQKLLTEPNDKLAAEIEQALLLL